MLKVEVNIGLIPATLPRSSQEFVVDCQVSHFLIFLYMKMFINTVEVDIVVMDMIRVISVVMMMMVG